MRWCYKTVHFPLKKEGFLGSAFLDEAEVEQSLNEYGQSGWELTSIIETQDGVIAFFKQPLGTKRLNTQSFKETEEVHPPHFVDEVLDSAEQYEEDELHHEDSSSDDDIHSIRIE